MHVKDSLDLPRVVHLANVDDLPAAGPGDFLGIPLAHKSLVCGLDRVHLVSRATDTASKVMDTGSTAHLVDQVLDTETKAWTEVLVWVRYLTKCVLNVPGGRCINCSSTAPTLPLTSPKMVRFS